MFPRFIHLVDQTSATIVSGLSRPGTSLMMQMLVPATAAENVPRFLGVLAATRRNVTPAVKSSAIFVSLRPGES